MVTNNSLRFKKLEKHYGVWWYLLLRISHLVGDVSIYLDYVFKQTISFKSHTQFIRDKTQAIKIYVNVTWVLPNIS